MTALSAQEMTRTADCKIAGCAIELVAIGAGDKKAERRLKRRHNHAAYCPRCSAQPKPLCAR